MSTDFKSVDLSIQKKKSTDQQTDRSTDLIFWDTLLYSIFIVLYHKPIGSFDNKIKYGKLE